MVVHAAAFLMMFTDQISPTPIIVQCPQIAPEPWWKWLLQFALSVVPVAGGVGIAVWSFNATSRREHKRWLLDQKKTEWKELLLKVSEIELEIPVLLNETTSPDKVLERTLRVIPLLRSTVFIYETVISENLILECEALVEYISGDFSSSMLNYRNQTIFAVIDSSVSRRNSLGKSEEQLHDREKEIRNKYGAIIEKVRHLACADLKVS